MSIKVFEIKFSAPISLIFLIPSKVSRNIVNIRIKFRSIVT